MTKKYFILSMIALLGTLSLYYYSTCLHSVAQMGNNKSTDHSTFLNEQWCRSSKNNLFRSDRLQAPSISPINTDSAYVTRDAAARHTPINGNVSNLQDFIQVCRAALLSRPLKHRTGMISTIFRIPPHMDMVTPSCDGLWMEFGVFKGKSLSHMAEWKAHYCGNQSAPVYGFDTFSGLPTDWRSGYKRGTFKVDNMTMLKLPSNTALVKGLFIDTLPTHLRQIDGQYQCHMPVSFVHVDCDIYDGTRDIFFLLSSRFVPGTIIVFDELFNYPTYEQHEIKALYELLSGSDLQLVPIGSSYDIALKPSKDLSGQSYGFVVASKQQQ